MNKYLVQKMHNYWASNDNLPKENPYVDFQEGFKSACELLIPMLKKCYPHIYSQAVASHMLDGFVPKRHDLDDFIDEIEKVVE